jgi:rhodanese-related sulfurtransferase
VVPPATGPIGTDRRFSWVIGARHSSNIGGGNASPAFCNAACRYARGVGDLPFELSPARAAELVASDEAELIDVREPHERAAGHIPGSRHVPLAALADSAGELPADRPLVFQCLVGSRSAMAAFAFRRAGFDAHNLDGGIVAWADHGLPVEGRIAEH